ncbi:MAG: hypothetical protein RI897_4358, partial [Verrucomicrobiota bacterium]
MGGGGLLDGDFEGGFSAEGELVGLAFCIGDGEGGLGDIGDEDICDEVTAEGAGPLLVGVLDEGEFGGVGIGLEEAEVG